MPIQLIISRSTTRAPRDVSASKAKKAIVLFTVRVAAYHKNPSARRRTAVQPSADDLSNKTHALRPSAANLPEIRSFGARVYDIISRMRTQKLCGQFLLHISRRKERSLFCFARAGH